MLQEGHSLPSIIYSDNAPSFVAASKHLKTIYEHPECQEYLHNKEIKWKFNPTRAPWYGGFFERLIGITKLTLKKILGNSYVNIIELQTIITEVEMIINNRPLTYSSDSIDDLNPITPSELMCGFNLKNFQIPTEYLKWEDTYKKR